MATTKRRIPVTLPPDLDLLITSFATAYNMSQSQAIAHLLRYGIEMAEDDHFGMLADKLDAQVTEWQSHEEFWSELLPT